MDTSHLLFSILVPECLPADLWRQPKAEASWATPLQTAWFALQSAKGHETLPALAGGFAGDVSLGLVLLCVAHFV